MILIFESILMVKPLTFQKILTNFHVTSFVNYKPERETTSPPPPSQLYFLNSSLFGHLKFVWTITYDKMRPLAARIFKIMEILKNYFSGNQFFKCDFLKIRFFEISTFNDYEYISESFEDRDM